MDVVPAGSMTKVRSSGSACHSAWFCGMVTHHLRLPARRKHQTTNLGVRSSNLFEGTVAFVMISAVMKSMDPSLEESSRVTGAGKLRTLFKITLPLVLPGLLGAIVFVFAEMLGSFAAALVLGLPGRFFVVTTAIKAAGAEM
jgi:ABC-type sulfate transport system permease component